jgi:hypothetical protein
MQRTYERVIPSVQAAPGGRRLSGRRQGRRTGGYREPAGSLTLSTNATRSHVSASSIDFQLGMGVP